LSSVAKTTTDIPAWSGKDSPRLTPLFIIEPHHIVVRVTNDFEKGAEGDEDHSALHQTEDDDGKASYVQRQVHRASVERGKHEPELFGKRHLGTPSNALADQPRARRRVL
jgi:hypothetical protein